jgi:glycosyltransferase involved in cell wall biosynthesis
MISEKKVRRVLLFTDVLGGGTGNHLLSMIRHWDESRWQVEILTQTRATARVSPTVPVELTPARRWFDHYPLAQLRRLAYARDRVLRNRPDILHCYFFWPVIYGRILKWLGKVRFLVENREDEGFDWNGQAYALLRLTRKMPDRVVCVSEAVRQVVLERERLDPARTVVVHNGVEPGELAGDRSALRREMGIADEHLIVGMVANFSRSVKGVVNFLDAMPSIVEAVPSTRFLLLGRGKEEKMLRARARSLGVDPYVSFAGYREDVGRYYRIMDVSVLTSLSEGLSITLLESMNYGLPVIVTSVGGNPEVVVEGKTGYLVPPGDVPSFVDRVVRLLRNPGLRARMGEAARDRVRARFQMRDAAARYIAVYEQLLRTAESGPARHLDAASGGR